MKTGKLLKNMALLLVLIGATLACNNDELEDLKKEVDALKKSKPDTIYLNSKDTTYVYQYDTMRYYDTLVNKDTVYVYSYDTITSFDTIVRHDTVHVSRYDTIYVHRYDTIVSKDSVFVFDSVYLSSDTVWYGDLTISTQAQANMFIGNKFRHIVGALLVIDYNNEELILDMFDDLKTVGFLQVEKIDEIDLPNLEIIYDDLYLENVDHIKGFSKLRTIGNIATVVYSHIDTDLAFTNVKTVGEDMTLDQNSFPHFSGVEVLTKSLKLNYNASMGWDKTFGTMALREVGDLEVDTIAFTKSLTNLEEINGVLKFPKKLQTAADLGFRTDISIEGIYLYQSEITSLEGLAPNAADMMNASLIYIIECDNLVNLKGLEFIKKMHNNQTTSMEQFYKPSTHHPNGGEASIAITDNAKLNSLEGLYQLDEERASFLIRYNSLLMDFCPAKEIFSNPLECTVYDGNDAVVTYSTLVSNCP